MALELTTETGRVYLIDLERGFWSRSPFDYTNRIWAIKAGKVKAWPTQENAEHWRDGVPELGEHLYIKGYDLWYVSTPIVRIEEKGDGVGRDRADVRVPNDHGHGNCYERDDGFDDS